jgi:hypothetical protein
MPGVKMMDFAVRFAAEDADARMLSPVALNVEIRVETGLAARQQADFVPSAPPPTSGVLRFRPTWAINTKFAFWVTCGAIALYPSAHIVHMGQADMSVAPTSSSSLRLIPWESAPRSHTVAVS